MELGGKSYYYYLVVNSLLGTRSSCLLPLRKLWQCCWWRSLGGTGSALEVLSLPWGPPQGAQSRVSVAEPGCKSSRSQGHLLPPGYWRSGLQRGEQARPGESSVTAWKWCQGAPMLPARCGLPRGTSLPCLSRQKHGVRTAARHTVATPLALAQLLSSPEQAPFQSFRIPIMGVHVRWKHNHEHTSMSGTCS